MPQRGKSVVEAAVEHGLGEISKQHPELNQKSLGQYIDYARLESYMHNVNEYLAQQEEKGKKLSDREKLTFIYQQIAKHTASGEIFDERGREFILKKAKSLEEKTQDEDHLGRVIQAFHELYENLPESTAQRHPELTEAITTIQDAGFMKAAADILRERDLISEREYKQFQEDIAYKVGEEAGKTTRYLGKYVQRKIAAAILGFSGLIIILLSGAGITGDAIGSGGEGSGAIAGILFIVSAMLLVIKRTR